MVITTYTAEPGKQLILSLVMSGTAPVADRKAGRKPLPVRKDRYEALSRNRLRILDRIDENKGDRRTQPIVLTLFSLAV